MNATQIDPHEVGQVIVQLQEEIKIIKLQLENLPGYSTGEVP
jgi:polyribonucleotide nucleotidyltransferase